MRDTETTIRKVVLSAVLEPSTTQGDEIKVMGPTHPRAFTISQREQVVKDGLGDREESVRTAASSLIGTWIDVIDISGAKAENQDVKREEVPGTEEGVLSLLKLFDLGQDTVAVDALFSVFTTRPDIFDNIKFDGERRESRCVFASYSYTRQRSIGRRLTPSVLFSPVYSLIIVSL